MNFIVRLEVSETSKVITLSTDDLGFTQKEWNKLSESEKHSAMIKAIDGLPEQPYWCLDSYSEK